MDLASYIEQLSEIFSYLWEQMNWGGLKNYSNYALIAVILIIIYFIIKIFLKRKRAVFEYIEDGIALMLEAAQKDSLEELLSDLSSKFYTEYKKKYYFSLEIIIRNDQKTLVLFLPKKLYMKWASELNRTYQLKDVSKLREEFIEKLDKRVVGVDLELEKDFVYPLTMDEKKFEIQEFLQKEEWLFIQVACRPTDEKWRKVLDRYLSDLRRGKDPQKTYLGCLGGFLGVTAPFFTFLGDTLTSLIHGSSKEEQQKDQEVGESLQKKYDIIKTKQNRKGFETFVRASLLYSRESGPDDEKGYFLLDKFVDFVSTSEEFTNCYTVRNLYKQLNTQFKNDLLFANMDEDSVDILSQEEIASLIYAFISD